MIVEEKKADEKGCCGPNGEGLRCAGSRCMAWRWAWVDAERTSHDEDAAVIKWIEKQQSTTHGYCGLAGRP